MLSIREENADDYAAVRDLNRAAFEGDGEARLVDDLRNEGAVVLALVAVEDDRIVGHIMFSGLAIDTEAGILRAVSLAPMAVAPQSQRRGIGSALVQRGLELCRERGNSIVVVLGHPEYYPRFGFSPELAKDLHGPYSGEAWMALELVPAALYAVKGTVRYAKAFDALA
jgi:putative acetyltransferase